MKITLAQKFGVIQLLCKILLADLDERVRRQAAESLGKLNDARAISALSAAAA
jgi:HEAT repeat protein